MVGFRGGYVLATKLVGELVVAVAEMGSAKTIARQGRIDLLRIGELGRKELARRGAELLFQVVTECFVFPGDSLRSLVAGKPRTGRATSPAVQIFMVHTSVVQRAVSGLGPAAAHASRNARLELAKGLILDHFDDREATFTPAPAQAARGLADARLTEAELSPAMITAQLHVSVRTLQRAFANLDESFSACIRRRRRRRRRRLRVR